MLRVSTLVWVLVCGGCAGLDQRAAPAGAAATDAGFSGLIIGGRDDAPALVAALDAGPAVRSGVRPGDRIRAINGVAVDAGRARQRLRGAAGDAFKLELERAEQTLEVNFALGVAADWRGPARVSGRVPRVPNGAPVDNWIAQVMDGATASEGEWAPAIRRLARMFDELAANELGYNKSPHVRAWMSAPARAFEQARAWADAFTRTEPRALAPTDWWCAALALDCPAVDVALREVGIDDLARVSSTRSATPESTLDDLRYLLARTAAGELFLNQPEVGQALAAMQASMTVDLSPWLAEFARLWRLAWSLAPPAGEERAIPAALRARVSGPIVVWRELADGYLVVGGAGDNRYDVRDLVVVLDVGGNDEYRWPSRAAGRRQVIVDQAGDDIYAATGGGPAAAYYGVAIVLDHRGNDRYSSALGGCAAAFYGFAALVDVAGDDRYDCAAWSLGAAAYGGALLLDLDGHDRYRSRVLSQGVGGPRGFGALIDRAGDDRYRAGGQVPSVYRTPAAYLSLSQGVGYGFRPHDHGGIGLLVDGAGDDRYDGGEFSQGGGYFWGAGFLLEGGGDDRYRGDRYTQGFAAHQALGLLADFAGDDRYRGSAATAASQGAAWDQSIALLHDARGNDRYRGGDLSQGAAAQQALAILFDAAGDDEYLGGREVQGAAGGNQYHFDRGDPIVSLGVLFDGDGDDRYSSALAPNTERVASGHAAPGDSGQGRWGLARDRSCELRPTVTLHEPPCGVLPAAPSNRVDD